jgi:CDP-diacylglycerol--glycerol-3-phosphate 3-phosphatidyltransferase
MKSLPNILTIGRLVLTLAVLALLAQAGVSADERKVDLEAWAFVAFVVAAITDFFDGWLARKLNATSLLGAILDPIADKALVAAAIVGLLAVDVPIALPGGLILFREFAVSALRETLAPKGLRLPVTVLAKWKTTLQLFALGLLLFIQSARAILPLFPGWASLGLTCWLRPPAWAYAPLWLAAAVTVWTGIEYALSARNALRS